MDYIPLSKLDPPVQLVGEFGRRTFAWSMDLKNVLSTCLGYVLVVQVMNEVNRRNAPKAPAQKSREKKTWTTLDYLVFLHNVTLCLFSAYVCYNMVGTIRSNFSRPGVSFMDAFCDRDGFWGHAAGANYWIWVFYMSKYYELLDTAILLAKGRQSSFLQTFHHSGSILSMWLQSAAQLAFGWIFVLFNSFIHTIMYFYYTLTCLGYQPSWKRWLTRMQIAQFCIGDPIGLIYIFMPRCCPDDQRLVVVWPGIRMSMTQFRFTCGYVTLFFVAALILLFLDFSKKTYGDKSTASNVTLDAKRTSTRKAAAK